MTEGDANSTGSTASEDDVSCTLLSHGGDVGEVKQVSAASDVGLEFAESVT